MVFWVRQTCIIYTKPVVSYLCYIACFSPIFETIRMLGMDIGIILKYWYGYKCGYLCSFSIGQICAQCCHSLISSMILASVFQICHIQHFSMYDIFSIGSNLLHLNLLWKCMCVCETYYWFVHCRIYLILYECVS